MALTSKKEPPFFVRFPLFQRFSRGKLACPNKNEVFASFPPENLRFC